MKLTHLFLILALLSYAGAPSRPNTFSAGTTIDSDEVNDDLNTLYNYLSAGVDSFEDFSIVNADISASADIIASKLNLTTIAQNITNTGTFSNTGNVSIVGTVGVSSSLTSTTTTSVGWTIQKSANQECNTTCTAGCGFGFDGSTIVNCSDATADACLCLGSS